MGSTIIPIPEPTKTKSATVIWSRKVDLTVLAAAAVVLQARGFTVVEPVGASTFVD